MVVGKGRDFTIYSEFKVLLGGGGIMSPPHPDVIELNV